MTARGFDIIGHVIMAAFLGRPGSVFILVALFMGGTMLRSLKLDDFPHDEIWSLVLPVLCTMIPTQTMQSGGSSHR